MDEKKYIDVEMFVEFLEDLRKDLTEDGKRAYLSGYGIISLVKAFPGANVVKMPDLDGYARRMEDAAKLPQDEALEAQDDIVHDLLQDLGHWDLLRAFRLIHNIEEE